MLKFATGVLIGTVVGVTVFGQAVINLYKQDGSLDRLGAEAAKVLAKQGKTAPQYSDNVHQKNMEMLQRWSRGDFSDLPD